MKFSVMKSGTFVPTPSGPLDSQGTKLRLGLLLQRIFDNFKENISSYF